MSDVLKTKSGCSPNTDVLTFTINTNQVLDYIKSGLAQLISQKDSELKDLDLSKVELLSTKQGKSYYPFLLILPYNQVCYTKAENENKNVAPIFTPEESSYLTKAPLKNQLRHFLGTDRNDRFLYSSEDRNILRSPKWRRGAGVEEGRGLRDIIVLTEPRHYQFTTKDGRTIHQAKVLLDPFRVFYDMLVDVGGPNRPFIVEMEDVQKINRGLYSYTIKRRILKNKGNRRKSNEDYEIMKIN